MTQPRRWTSKTSHLILTVKQCIKTRTRIPTPDSRLQTLDYQAMTIEELKPVIESLIFVAEEPITVKQLAAILDGETKADIEAATEALVEEFKARGGGLEIRCLANGYQIRTRPEYSEYV